MKNQILIIAFAFIVSSIAAQQKGINQLPTANRQLPTSTYAVVVGISDYQDPGIPDLRFADKDAEAFAGYLRSNAGGKLDNDHLKVLINQQATMAQFGIALDWLMENAKEGDKVIIYFSGHGDVEKKTITQPGFLLCWDAPARVYISGGAFALPMLQEVISTISIQNKAKVIVITDACRSGTLAGNSVNGSQATAANLSKQYANEIKILSCQPNEYSIEGEQWGGGRGAFSYHLVEALYGFADKDNDQSVTLQEVGRYLEDHVSEEVAPLRQVPLILGDRYEKLASVDASVLASLKSSKTGQMAMLTSIESKGIEENILREIDTSLKKKYQLFKSALKSKHFFEPANACAEDYYTQLINEPKLERLFTTIKRNYAAALQDDAQQIINIWLKADVKELECIGKSIKLQPIPKQLGRASELLGSGHYMFKSLSARKLLFEGILLSNANINPDKNIANHCLSVFRQSLQLEPQSAIAWNYMSRVYMYNLVDIDSAFICTRQAVNISPNWILPYTQLGNQLIANRKFDLAKQALYEAEKIDSLHPFVINMWANWFQQQYDKLNKEKSLVLFEKYKKSGGPMYPCWHNDYGMTLMNLGRYSEAEKELQMAVEMDSAKPVILSNLALIYMNSNRFEKAEIYYKKALSIDSTLTLAWINLGSVYGRSGRINEVEQTYIKAYALDSANTMVLSNYGGYCVYTGQFKKGESFLVKALKRDSTLIESWDLLGAIYDNTERIKEAEQAYKKALQLDSNYVYSLVNLGTVYLKTGRDSEGEKYFTKAIALEPTNISAYYNYAILKIHLKQTDKAFEFIELSLKNGMKDFDALQMDPDLALLRDQKERWNALMKKYFPDK